MSKSGHWINEQLGYAEGGGRKRVGVDVCYNGDTVALGIRVGPAWNDYLCFKGPTGAGVNLTSVEQIEVLQKLLSDGLEKVKSELAKRRAPEEEEQ